MLQEELQMQEDIREYELFHVPLKLSRRDANSATVVVPGASEFRPACLYGDVLRLRVATADHQRQAPGGGAHLTDEFEVCSSVSLQHTTHFPVEDNMPAQVHPSLPIPAILLLTLNHHHHHNPLVNW